MRVGLTKTSSAVRAFVIVLLIGTVGCGAESAPSSPSTSATVEPTESVATVPDVEGLAEEEARNILESAGYEVNVRSTDWEPGLEAGTVAVQRPEAGSTSTPGDIVFLEVVEDVELAKVPDLAGTDGLEARRRLEDAGFDVTIEKRPTRNVEVGHVVTTEPPGGDEWPIGQPVILVVAERVPLTGEDRDFVDGLRFDEVAEFLVAHDDEDLVQFGQTYCEYFDLGGDMESIRQLLQDYYDAADAGTLKKFKKDQAGDPMAEVVIRLLDPEGNNNFWLPDFGVATVIAVAREAVSAYCPEHRRLIFEARTD